MRGRHSPMIAAAGSLMRLGKGAADHDRIGTARERFANIAAFAHSPIRDDRNVARVFFKISITRGSAVDGSGHLWDSQTKDAARGAGCAGTDGYDHRH